MKKIRPVQSTDPPIGLAKAATPTPQKTPIKKAFDEVVKAIKDSGAKEIIFIHDPNS